MRRGAAILAASLSLLAAQGLADDRAEVAALQVGAAMEDFGLRELDLGSGRLTGMVWLSDFVGEPGKARSKLLLLNFFASWCKPCRTELDSLASLQRRYSVHGLQVLSVNFRRSDESVDAAVRATQKLLSGSKLGYPLLFDRYTNRPQLLYMGGRAMLPCNVFIDATGRITRRLQGAQTSKLEELEAEVRSQLGLSEAVP